MFKGINPSRLVRAGFIASSLVACSVVMTDLVVKTNNETREAAELVEKYKPEKYKQLSKKYKFGEVYFPPKVWSDEAQFITDSINSKKSVFTDSLKLDSIARVNYAKGLQAACDSLAKLK